MTQRMLKLRILLLSYSQCNIHVTVCALVAFLFVKKFKFYLIRIIYLVIISESSDEHVLLCSPRSDIKPSHCGEVIRIVQY